MNFVKQPDGSYIEASVIGKIKYEKSVFWVGPFKAGSIMEQVGNLDYGNDGSESGTIYGKFVQYPGTPQEQPVDPAREASWSRYHSAHYFVQRILHINIPNLPGQTVPVGVKVWSETESEPDWGTPEKTHIWNIQIQEEPVICEDYTNKFECQAHGCYWWHNNTCHPNPQPPCESNKTQAECEAVGCYWYDGACHFEPEPVEGQAVITSVEVPSSFTPNEAFTITTKVRNDGGDDKLFVKIINTDTGAVLKDLMLPTPIPSGIVWTYDWIVTIPQTTDFHGRVGAGHET